MLAEILKLWCKTSLNNNTYRYKCNQFEFRCKHGRNTVYKQLLYDEFTT